MALALVIAALSGDENTIKKALFKVDYHLRRNYIAFKSHSLTKLQELSG